MRPALLPEKRTPLLLRRFAGSRGIFLDQIKQPRLGNPHHGGLVAYRRLIAGEMFRRHAVRGVVL